jgi:hypothetical protein
MIGTGGHDLKLNVRLLVQNKKKSELFYQVSLFCCN